MEHIFHLKWSIRIERSTLAPTRRRAVRTSIQNSEKKRDACFVVAEIGDVGPGGSHGVSYASGSCTCVRSPTRMQ